MSPTYANPGPGFYLPSKEFLMQSGDVVTLKSGGPKMTIQDIDGLVANCVYTLNGRFASKSFPVAMLVKVEEKVGK